MNTVTKIKQDDATPVAKTYTFAEALSLLQGEVRPAIKESENPHFKSKYADLAAIWDVAREPMVKYGFSVVQAPQFDGDTTYLETTLLHVSGDTFVSRYPMRPTKPDMQGWGSALTYCRRQALSSMLGIVADIDDDGNHASGRGNGGPPPAPNAPQGNITPQQVEEVLALIKSTNSDIEKFCTYLKVDCIPAIRAADYTRAIAALKGKQK